MTDYEFEWDEAKGASNKVKHGVSFQEAETVFNDPLALSYDDARHSSEENRYITIGNSNLRRLVVICHTYRPGAVRIISARQATKGERYEYEEG